jgi:hypothetical protein
VPPNMAAAIRMEFPSEVSDFGGQSQAGASGRRSCDQAYYSGKLALLDVAAAPSDTKHGAAIRMEFPSEVSEFGGQPQAGVLGRRGRDQTGDIFRGL